MWLRLWPCAAIFATVLLCACGTASRTAGEADVLPAAALESLHRGVIATRFHDYEVAVQHFEEAWAAAPEAPIVHLNLGLAESKIRSHELRAAAWFGAYLAARPDAPNANLVTAEISVLESRSRAFIEETLALLKDVVPEAGLTFVQPDLRAGKPDQSECFRSIRLAARLLADAGDLVSATGLEQAYKRCSGPYPYPALSEAEFWSTIAIAQALNGNLAGARRIAARIPSSETGHVTSTRSFIDSRQADADVRASSDPISQDVWGWFSHLGMGGPPGPKGVGETARARDCEDAGFALSDCPVLSATAFTKVIETMAPLGQADADKPFPMYQTLWTIGRQLVDGHRLVTTKLKRQGTL